MPLARLTRRRAALALASLALPGLARPAQDELEVRFRIEREARQPSGDIARRSFDNAFLMRSGETKEVDFRDEYRVRLSAVDSGATADVRIALWDNQQKGDAAGDASVQVPIGGQATVTILTSDNIQTRVTLKAQRRAAGAH